MPINVDGEVFRLDTTHTSYWFRTTQWGHLEHVYYGPRLDVVGGWTLQMVQATCQALALKHTAVIGTSVDYDSSGLYSLDTGAWEWSGSGYGDMRFSPIEAVMPDGSYASDFRYFAHEIVAGSVPTQCGLPVAKVLPDAGETLRISLRDDAGQVSVDLLYTVCEQADVITRRVMLCHEGSGAARPRLAVDAVEAGSAVGSSGGKDAGADFVVNRLLSGMVDIPDRGFIMRTLDGGWIKEAHVHDRPVEHGMLVNSSTTGSSSNRHNPGLMLAEAGASETQGWVYGFNLVYSGNHMGVVERSTHDIIRVGLGMNDHNFQWRLRPGEMLESPEMVMTVSDRGYNGVSQQFHKFVTNHIIPPYWKGRDRPVVLNNWEAHFFDFTESKLLDLARAGSKLGVELFVLDDGWFGARNNDRAGLGDYSVNRKKLPSGLDGFARKINSMGMLCGLWCEPEMVNEDSDLFRSKPHWAVAIPGRRQTLGRNQMVLDLCNVEVQDYIIDQLGAILDNAKIDYVKWDMNRHISQAWSPTLRIDQQGEFYHRYILGLYRVLREIFESRPHILLESCSSGGNRFDLGMLSFSPQIWASDDTDPVERLSIQQGLSYFYPLSTMGAHVTASPHQQTLRSTALSTRFNVAAFGLLGYELDLKYVTWLEKKEIRQQIAFYKAHRATMQQGVFSRLDCVKSNKFAWQVARHDAQTGQVIEVVSGFFQTLATASEGADRLQVLDLPADTLFEITSHPQCVYLDRFGQLLKHIVPQGLSPKLVEATVGRVYHLTDCLERYQATGTMLASGIMLNNQFMGTNYTKETRLLGDFGSTLYVVRPCPAGDQAISAGKLTQRDRKPLHLSGKPPQAAGKPPRSAGGQPGHKQGKPHLRKFTRLRKQTRQRNP